MSIKSLMIANVESQHTAEYIANVFWNQSIAHVSSITLIPYLKETEVLQLAYIDIEYWCDSEVAYNFLQRLKIPEGEARVVHIADEWWALQINTHNNGHLLAGIYTRKFSYSYFEKNTNFDDKKIEYALANSNNVTLREDQTVYVI